MWGNQDAVAVRMESRQIVAHNRVVEEGGSNSVVECQLPKLDVAGSNPVSRSNPFNESTIFPRLGHNNLS